MRPHAIAASCALHGLVTVAAAVLIGGGGVAIEEAATEPATIDIVDVVAPPAPADDTEGAAATAMATAAATPGPARPARAPVRVTAPPPPSASMDDQIGEHVVLGPIARDGHGVADDGDADGGGDGDGDGGGDGHGHGHGHGHGITRLAARPVDVPKVEAPVAPKVSKARPARLVWPARDMDPEPGHLFIAQVTVDRDGFVVGAHLTHGVDGPRDTDASNLVFRFRYDPALDDDGRPVRSTVEQSFQIR